VSTSDAMRCDANSKNNERNGDLVSVVCDVMRCDVMRCDAM